jgi:SAM-dependent methyltransferase
MANEDALRWNQRYRCIPRGWYDNPRSFLVEHLQLLPTNGLALDLAMGVGQNAELLTRRGLRVLGVDISITAVRQARRRCPDIQAVVADLDRFQLPGDRFDVLLNFYYLQRRNFHLIRETLKPGGLLLFESLTRPMRSVKPEIDPAHLLDEGELLQAFAGWDILFYREGWLTSDHGNQKAVASLIARKPGNS